MTRHAVLNELPRTRKRPPSVEVMSSPGGRKRGSAAVRRTRGTPTVGVQVDIDPDVKAILDGYHAATGLPQWALIEAAIRAGKPGPNGYPENWELPVSPQTPLDLPQEASTRAA